MDITTTPEVRRILDSERDERTAWESQAAARDSLDREAAAELARHVAKREAERAEVATADQQRLAEQEARINRSVADIAEGFARFITKHDSNRMPNGFIRTQTDIPSGEQRWIAATQRIISDLERRITELEAASQQR